MGEAVTIGKDVDRGDAVAGVGERAEHPVGDRPQVGAVSFEFFGQEMLVVHGVLLDLVPYR
ncbi:hypothetical protein ACIG56_22940 [Nocardia fusca]|uniref:hypothetical protein n=1 Tax=Nocardia fusca TaxID=941183 RepID=UPI0037C5BF86